MNNAIDHRADEIASRLIGGLSELIEVLHPHEIDNELLFQAIQRRVGRCELCDTWEELEELDDCSLCDTWEELEELDDCSLCPDCAEIPSP